MMVILGRQDFANITCFRVQSIQSATHTTLTQYETKKYDTIHTYKGET